MGNGWVYPSISHSTEKYIETHRIGRAWEIGSYIFSIVWVLFSIRFPSYGTRLTRGNCMALPIKFPYHGKMQQNSLCEISGCFSTVFFFLFVSESGDSLTLFRIGIFGAAHGMGVSKICQIYHTMTKFGTVVSNLKKI